MQSLNLALALSQVLLVEPCHLTHTVILPALTHWRVPGTHSVQAYSLQLASNSAQVIFVFLFFVCVFFYFLFSTSVYTREMPWIHK